MRGKPLVKLFCLVHPENDPAQHIFPVKIPTDSTVGDLKEAIKVKKHPKLEHLAADCLILWKVSIPDDDEIGATLNALHSFDKVQMSHATWPLSEYFGNFDSLAAKTVNVLVELPCQAELTISPSPSYVRAFGDVRQGRKQYIDIGPDRAPSSQASPSEFSNLQQDGKRNIQWNRPPSAATTIPVTLLHPIFGQFVDDCKSHQPTAEDNSLVFEMSVAMSGFFSKENERVAAFRDVLGHHGIYIVASAISRTEYRTDGDMQINGHRYFIAEHKNEIGSSGAEPYAQGILYYFHATKASVLDHPTFNFPCIIVTVFGGHISFSGAVWSTRPNFQILSTALPLFWHHTDINMRISAARHFGALKRALSALKNCYSDLHPTANPEIRFNPVPPLLYIHIWQHYGGREIRVYIPDRWQQATLHRSD